jgi:2-polyprenyl-6-methoxyphenol hydroxylase-like FAD-dependent oxidoreductase
MTTRSTRCCIVGGGPAGVMLGFLLARAGLDVVVLEKHADFFRDFRGDTIHPSTLELMHELGLLPQFLKVPHQEARTIGARYAGLALTFADFSHLPTVCRFIALMPQWDFLKFLADQGRRYPGFHLVMSAEATDLIEESGRVVGVRATTADGPLEVRAPLVIGCDGRHSVVRDKSGLALDELGAPMDVLWFRLSHKPGDLEETTGIFAAGHVFVLIDRGDYWQCAFIIPKDSMEAVRARGLEAFRAQIAEVEPMFRDRVGEIADWDQVKLLSVAVNRLRRWHRPGLLCIGDAAHAMSPIGGVGVNLAVQDAVAAANILAEPLRRGDFDADLERVQKRRAWPTMMTQRMQLLVQNKVITGVLDDTRKLEPPLLVKLMSRWPLLRRIPARVVGMGFRPEHVRTPEMAAVSSENPPA